MRRLPRHSRRWSPAVLRLVCMNGKIVQSRGPIHYLLGNDCKKGPVLHTPAAYSNIPLITLQVIVSPVATRHFLDIATKGGRRDQSYTNVPSSPACPSPTFRGRRCNSSLSCRRGVF